MSIRELQLDKVHPQLVKAIEANVEQILTKSFLTIDPSSGSKGNAAKGWTGSMPGYAVFRKGKLVRAGEIVVPDRLLKGINYTPHRLQYIAQRLRTKFPKAFNLLVIETFHYKQGVRTNAASFQQLNQSVGAIVAALQWKSMVGVLAFEWTKFKPEQYMKSDANDAISLGVFVIRVAELIKARNTGVAK